MRIGVVPAKALAERPRLFAALALAFDATFCDGASGADAVVAFEPFAEPGVPALVLEGGPCRLPGEVRLHDEPLLDARLRGRRLRDRAAAGTVLQVRRGDTVLASTDGAPVWTIGADGSRRAAVQPDEIVGAESLRDQFVDGRFLGLLPIVELLRAVTREPWTPPPARACFVLDDPNLHARRYGHADFERLAADAARIGFHMAVATVPLDAWYVNRHAAELFRARTTLSLAVHGSTHVRDELAVRRPAAERRALVAQALRRVAALERRGGVHVARVMVAPHERCSEEMIETLARSELEALCYGWGDRRDSRPLADWEPADLRGSGFPVLSRRPLSADRGELALRAYLDQPLILALHHGDLADGHARVADAAVAVSALADVHWLALDDLARCNIATRTIGSTLHVRAYARRFPLVVPPGVDSVAVELPPTHRLPDEELLFDGGVPRPLAEPFPVRPGDTLRLALRRVDAFDLAAVPQARPRVWEIERRLAAETRDRLSALGRRA